MSEIEQAIREAAGASGLPCAAAFFLAEQLRVPPHAIRESADRIGLRIVFCQLGLFGYDGFGERRLARALSLVPPELSSAVAAAVADGRLPCATAWRLADERGLSRLLLGSVAETLGVRISDCSLGCFGATDRERPA